MLLSLSDEAGCCTPQKSTVGTFATIGGRSYLNCRDHLRTGMFKSYSSPTERA